MRRSHYGVRAGICAALISSAYAACAPHRTLTRQSDGAAADADAIIAHYYRAVGGRDRLASVDSRHMWGVYTEGTLTANTDIVWKRPALRRVNVHAPGFDYSEGFDGSTWEYSFQRQQLKLDSGVAADAGRRGAEFDESFVDYRGKEYQVHVIGGELFDGRAAHRVGVTLTDGWEKQYLFDDGTGLIVALRKAMPLHATGAPVTSVTTYEDWRDVSGVLTPHRFVERDMSNGRLMNTLQWDSIRTNVHPSDRELARPPDE